jgi:4-hydroxybenzoate polyprenyltransferase/phosphoglycolate phosphatase-like HAD superfamily hydrolase
MEQSVPSTRMPIVVDLDGTLIRTDSLFEAVIQAIRHDLAALLALPIWLWCGRAAFKQRVAAGPEFDWEHVPRNEDFVAWLRQRSDDGHRIVLATAAARRTAEQIAARFPFIDEIIATDGSTNLKGRAKAEALRARFPEGFIYAGDSAADLEVWRVARDAVVVDAPAAVERKVRAFQAPLAVFPHPPMTLSTYRRALRLHQWAKNLLIFVPLVLGGKLLDADAWLHGLVAFAALGLVASSTYVINDLWDLADDRRHWWKRGRPLATGELSIRRALLLAAVGLVGGFALIAAAGFAAAVILAVYLALALGYTLWLKREPVLDVLVLAGLFTVRLGLGVAATQVKFSYWLLVFSMFIFLSLSLAKRSTEIGRMLDHGHVQAPGRGYRASDAPVILALGVAAMLGAVLIMVIYLINDAFPAGFYRQPVFLWAFPVVLFLWLGRIWLLCHRGELHDDPVAFALKDPVSLVYGAIMAVAFVAAVL